MPVFRALGLGLVIIVLKLLVPAVFNELETTIIALLEAARMPLEAAAGLATVNGGASVPLSLPSAPLYNP